MQWYKDRLDELSRTAPILSVCGDDCAVCPRYLARTDEELHQTAVFWHKAGWRDHIVTNEEIRCGGCGTRGACAFMLMPCLKEKGLNQCTDCPQHPCGKITDMLLRSADKEAQCRKACGDEAFFAMMKRAFYEKEKNLGLEETE